MYIYCFFLFYVVDIRFVVRNIEMRYCVCFNKFFIYFRDILVNKLLYVVVNVLVDMCIRYRSDRVESDFKGGEKI